ncbi:MAG: hypothetical protein WA175_09990 [Candidatus Acidiferrales bacterium]
MGTLGNAMYVLLLAWGVVTAVLICMLIYRSALSTHEEEQIFLCTGQEYMAADQRAIVARIERLTLPIRILMAASGALLAAIAVVGLWQVFNKF